MRLPAAVAAELAGLLTAILVLAAGDGRLGSPAWLAGAGLLTLAAGLILARPGALTVALALLAVAYALRLALSATGLDALAPAVGGALLLTAELAGWSLEAVGVASPERPVLAARLRAITALVALGSGTGVVALAVATVARGPASTALTTAGAVCVVAVVAGVTRGSSAGDAVATDRPAGPP